MSTEERKELRLLDKKKNGIQSMLVSWTGVILVLLVVTVLLYALVLIRYLTWMPLFVVFAVLLHLAAVLHLIGSDMDSTAKITWMLVISIFPIFSVLLYIYTRIDLGSHLLRKNFKKLQERNHEMLQYDKDALRSLSEDAPDIAALCRYVADAGNFPVSTGNKVDYYELIVPGIPDKKMIYTLTKSYFKRLIESGVKIYTYTPGFVHAKVFVSDGCKASVGTINLDYRSLYHHFECGTYLYNVPCISDIERDFAATREKCRQVTLTDVKNEGWRKRCLGTVLRTIAPLM